MDNTSEVLAREILTLREDISNAFEHWVEDDENMALVQEKFSALLDCSRKLEIENPDFYKNLEKSSPLSSGFLKALNEINTEINTGYTPVIERVTEVKDDTILALVEYFKTNNHYSWLKNNPKNKVLSVTETISDNALVGRLLDEILPAVKAEEMGDLIALAFSGKLSENYETISKLASNEEKIASVKLLMAAEKLYVNTSFEKLIVTDQTEEKKRITTGGVFKSRGIAAANMIDSVFMNSDNTEMFCVVSTSRSDVKSQKDQLFRLIHTLEDVKSKNELNIGDAKNPNINIVFHNVGFFCTQSEKESNFKQSAGRKGGSLSKEGFSSVSNRAEFERLIEKGSVVSKHEMDKLNGLVTLSLLGNCPSYPCFPYTYQMSDLTSVNPITVGADTLWLKDKFDEISKLSGVEKEQKFFDFLIDYSIDVVNTLNKLSESTALSKDSVRNSLIERISSSFSGMLNGVTNNFTSYNLGNNGLTEELQEKLQKLEEGVDKFNLRQPNTVITFTPLDTVKAFKKAGDKMKSKVDYNNKLLVDTWNSQVINTEKRKEPEAKDMRDVMLDLSQRILASDTGNPNKIQKLHDRLDIAAKDLYKKIGSKERNDRVPVYRYFLAAASGLMSLNSNEDQKIANKSFRNNDYFKITKNLIYSHSNNRKTFTENIKKLQKENPELAQIYQSVDSKIVNFVENMATKNGAIDIIKSGGYELNMELLVASIENEMGMKSKNTKKKMI